MNGTTRRIFYTGAVVLGLAFPAGASAGVLDQQQPTTGGLCPPASSPVSYAQTFVAGASGQLDQVDVSVLTPTGLPTEPLAVEIRDTVGAPPTAVPGANVLATANVAPILASPQPIFVSVPFAVPATVTAGTQYAIQLSAASTEWNWCSGPGDLYPLGAPFYQSLPNPAFVPSPFGPSDFAFKTYVASAAPVTRFVDDDHVQCPTAAYTTIQSAVDAAAAGDTINVCRGTYNESVTIGSGKDNLTLNSYTAPVAAIVKGATPFTVNGGAKGVTIQKFRIEPTDTGISVTGGVANPVGTTFIRNNLVVGGKTGLRVVNAAAGTVRDNSFLGQTEFGVTVSAEAFLEQASADVMNNTVTGGPGSHFGILISSGIGGSTVGTMFGNTASKVGGPGLAVQNANVFVKANTSFSNESGLRVVGDGGSAIENNKLNSNSHEGLLVDAGGFTFTSNNANGNVGTDCKDLSTGTGTSGTANTYTANYGQESSPAGICKK